jgi:hypothetical protein
MVGSFEGEWEAPAGVCAIKLRGINVARTLHCNWRTYIRAGFFMPGIFALGRVTD